MFRRLKIFLFILILFSLPLRVTFAQHSQHRPAQHKKINHTKAHHTSHHSKKIAHKNTHKQINKNDDADNDLDNINKFSVNPSCEASSIEKEFAQTTSIPLPDMNSNNTPTPNIVDFVDKTVSSLRYSSYKMGGKHFDFSRGVYVLDCSGFVDHVLATTSPQAYSKLVRASGSDSPASQHYYNFFKELSDDSNNYWNKVENVAQLKPGDILVFRYKNRRGIQTGGHVMVVMNSPMQNEDVFLVRVADSAPTRHSEDTRPQDTSGIGIGTLLLKTNQRTGRPSAYAWGINGYWNTNVTIVMARPLDAAIG